MDNLKIHILYYRRYKMEKNQKINCTVSSCRFNSGKYDRCLLESITVAPITNVKTMEPDESMCASYKYKDEN